jgi:hypothetical protein
MSNFIEEMEAEYWGYYDAITEAYQATADDANEFARTEYEYDAQQELNESIAVASTLAELI